MLDIELLVQAAQKEVLDSYRREFDQLSAGFRDLDGKAQGTATLAGAFLAAGLALINRPGGLSSSWSQVILLVAVVGLASAIVLAVQALRIRKVRSCPSGDEVAKLLNTIKAISNDQETAKRLAFFYGDSADLWKSCIRERRGANEAKSRYIWLAQLCLAVTALSIASLIASLLVAS